MISPDDTVATAPNEPGDGDQASNPDLPSCAACTNLQKYPARDRVQAEDQDRYLIDVQFDLWDAIQTLGSSEERASAESHEALRRTLRIWLKHRANGTHPVEPDFLISLFQFGYTKKDLSFDQFEPQDLATVRCLKDASADLGLKVLLVFWKLTGDVSIKANFKDNFVVLEDVPAGASKESHQRDYSMKSHVEVEKLVDPDDGELDVDYLPSSITNRDDLAERCIQRDGDLFYDNHSMKWESNLALDLRPDYNPDSPLTDSDTDRGSPPVDSQRATATQCYQAA